MNDVPTSVIVVSRDRPAALARCVLGLSQLYHQPVEIIVVADQPGLDAVSRWAGQIKTVAFDAPNIACARNLGLGRASGEIVAFIDDDAVPEPTWLCHLLDAFALTDADAAGGYVRGRNGISYQWTGRSVARDGTETRIDIPFDGATLPDLPDDEAVKVQGTNMAFRTAALRALGGFDPAFHYYLDETDVCLRLAASGRATAIVPKAQVHHSFAASPRRREDRVPRDLRQIGASEAVFLRRHGDPGCAATRWDAVRLRHHKALLRHMAAGRIVPGDVRRLIQTLRHGWDEGLERDLTGLSPLPESADAFLPFQQSLAASMTHDFGWRAWRNRNVQKSAQVVERGNRHTLYLLSLWPLRHWVRFDERGFWCQTGGLIGRSDRTKRPKMLGTFKDRYEIEAKRVSEFRDPRI